MELLPLHDPTTNMPVPGLSAAFQAIQKMPDQFYASPNSFTQAVPDTAQMMSSVKSFVL